MTESRAAFFDRIAHGWDARVDLERMTQSLGAGLEELGVAPDASVVDLGCGTGNLTAALARYLGPRGRVWAVDFSSRMIAEARGKVTDGRVEWVTAEAAALPLGDGVADEVICFSAWPHFPDPRGVAIEQRRVLRPGGFLTVWHALPRQRINAIHAAAGEAVASDLLPAGEDLAGLLESAGYVPTHVVDDDERYLVRARRGEP